MFYGSCQSGIYLSKVISRNTRARCECFSVFIFNFEHVIAGWVNTPMIYANICISGEDPQAAQRAQAICQACDFQSNSLFVLPFGDHLLGYITRYAFSLLFLLIATKQFIPFVANVTFLHPLKTSENRKVFWWFQGYRNVALGKIGYVPWARLPWRTSAATKVDLELFFSNNLHSAKNWNGMFLEAVIATLLLKLRDDIYEAMKSSWMNLAIIIDYYISC